MVERASSRPRAFGELICLQHKRRKVIVYARNDCNYHDASDRSTNFPVLPHALPGAVFHLLDPVTFLVDRRRRFSNNAGARCLSDLAAVDCCLKRPEIPLGLSFHKKCSYGGNNVLRAKREGDSIRGSPTACLLGVRRHVLRGKWVAAGWRWRQATGSSKISPVFFRNSTLPYIVPTV